MVKNPISKREKFLDLGVIENQHFRPRTGIGPNLDMSSGGLNGALHRNFGSNRAISFAAHGHKPHQRGPNSDLPQISEKETVVNLCNPLFYTIISVKFFLITDYTKIGTVMLLKLSQICSLCCSLPV